jgi:hypothetical protein
MVAAGLSNHNFVFFSAVGEPLETTYLPYNRWAEVLETLVGRRPTMEETTAIVAIGTATNPLSPQKLPLRCH